MCVYGRLARGGVAVFSLVEHTRLPIWLALSLGREIFHVISVQEVVSEERSSEKALAKRKKLVRLKF